jgi:5'-nucleotidase
MNNNRRTFISQLSLVAAFSALSRPMVSIAATGKKINTLQAGGRQVAIYHTNDLHGHIQPVFGEAGGLNQIGALLKSQETHGLLLDAGGFLNLTKSYSAQKAMIMTMNAMGYHAATIGNDELALGPDYLASLAKMMQFSLVNCNYSFNGELNDLVKPYVIVRSGRFKTGITGVGQKISGVKYNDAVNSVNIVARHLKENEKCDLVICLSHLGYDQPGDEPDNRKLAKQSEHLDLIISGNNNLLLASPLILRNKLKHEVLIGLAAYNGLMMGKAIFNFENGHQKQHLSARNLITGQRSGETFAESFTRLKANEKFLAAS